MKKIELLSMKLENFKGIKSLELNFNENETNIFGANATGKTTILDAFMWILFDKDSSNRKSFSIKTRDAEGNEIHRLDHKVTAVLKIDEEEVELSKKYAEKWVKKRGNIEQEFNSNETTYHIDGIKQSASKYKAYISKIVDEELFKLLTNPLFFNEQYEWKKRREMLIQIAGNISDDEVIDSDENLKELKELLGKHSITDKLIQIAEQKKDLRQKLERIPDRIDEAEKAKEDVTGLNPSDIEGEIQVIEEQKKQKQEELQNLRNGGMKASLLEQEANLKSELAKIKNDLQSGIYVQIDEKNKAIAEVSNVLNTAKLETVNLTNESTQLEHDIKRNNQLLIDRGEEWKQTYNQKFDEHQKTCPTCSQDLPEEQINELIGHFNQNKAQKLALINEDGEHIKETIKKSQVRQKEIKLQLEQLNDECTNSESELAILQEELSELKKDLNQVTANSLYIVKQKELELVAEQMLDETGSSASREAEVQLEIDKLQQEMNVLQTDLNKFSINERQTKRIEELNAEMDDASIKYTELEKASFLIEAFNKKKSNLLESKINEKFEFVTFQLFKNQINGGIEECCETLFKGVPYNSGLNNAARINGGIDIINALSKHLQLLAPVFIDNRESVTNLIDTDSQVINLIVSEQDKKLRVEA